MRFRQQWSIVQTLPGCLTLPISAFFASGTWLKVFSQFIVFPAVWVSSHVCLVYAFTALEVLTVYYLPKYYWILFLWVLGRGKTTASTLRGLFWEKIFTDTTKWRPQKMLSIFFVTWKLNKAWRLISNYLEVLKIYICCFSVVPPKPC